MVERLSSAMAGDGPSGQGLDAAIMALRRGEPVLLDGRDHAVLTLAAEFVTDDNLARLRAVSGRPLRMVLTRRRAVALGLGRREAAPAALSGAVSIAVAPLLSAAVIRNLADPAASLGAEPPGLGPKPANAEGDELAAVALARLAALLPGLPQRRHSPGGAPISRSSRPTRC